MIAALPMYDWPEAQADNDAFWSRAAGVMAGAGIDAPAALTRGRPAEATWTDPTLLLGQTCGLPYIAGRCGSAVLVGRPVYAAEGAGRGTYRSALVCRADAAGELADFRGCRVAINDYGSQSGCNALADAVRPLAAGAPFFAEVRLSGSHRASAAMVADGAADLAAIDAAAWALFARHEAQRHARLRVLQWTGVTPALPFITAGQFAQSVPAILSALDAAATDRSGPTVPIGVLPATDADYDAIRRMRDRVRGMVLAPGEPAI